LQIAAFMLPVLAFTLVLGLMLVLMLAWRRAPAG